MERPLKQRNNLSDLGSFKGIGRFIPPLWVSLRAFAGSSIVRGLSFKPLNMELLFLDGLRYLAGWVP